MDIGTVCSMEEYVDRMPLKYAFNHLGSYTLPHSTRACVSNDSRKNCD